MAPGQATRLFLSALRGSAVRIAVLLCVTVVLAGDSSQVVQFLAHSFSAWVHEDSDKEYKETEEAGKSLASDRRSWQKCSRENGGRSGRKLLASPWLQEPGHFPTASLSHQAPHGSTLAGAMRVPLRC